MDPLLRRLQRLPQRHRHLHIRGDIAVTARRELRDRGVQTRPQPRLRPGALPQIRRQLPRRQRPNPHPLDQLRQPGTRRRVIQRAQQLPVQRHRRRHRHPIEELLRDHIDHHHDRQPTSHLRQFFVAMQRLSTPTKAAQSQTTNIPNVADSEFKLVLDAVRRLVRNDVLPREQEIEDTDAIPEDLRRKAADMGLFGFAIPEEHGGLGLNMRQEAELVMELGYTTPAFRSMFGTNNGIAGQVLLVDGSDEQKQRYLPGMAAGDITASFALTEDEAGSDPSTLTTTATRDGDNWVLNGSKRFITNAPIADLFMVFARSGAPDSGAAGISVF